MQKRLLGMFAVLAAVTVISGCGGDNKNYKTQADWAEDSNYCFGVETPNYDGDILKAGTYYFTTESHPEDLSETPIVWDIYTSKNFYTKESELHQSEYRATVGGYENNNAALDLDAGTYVYINSSDVIGKAVGILHIRLK